MAQPLTVRLLGAPQFSEGAQPVVCTSKKSLALFAYLALSGKRHTRHDLAALLWGRRDVDAARTSLRVALHRLPAPLVQCLHLERDSVGIDPAAAAIVDVDRFEALATEASLESLEAAAALYNDELLKDFDATASPEFDDWLHAQRVRLAQIAQRVFDGILAQRADRARRNLATATTERESALTTAVRWAALMPASEAAHRWLMQLYLEMGRRDAALAQYELCQRALAVTHGRAPAPETRALQQAALAGGGEGATLAASAPPASDPVRAPPTIDADVAATTFVGRLDELAQLEALFADPACRLVTLHGLGGAGKTRLAHAFATQIGGRFANGVTWVTLGESASPDPLPQAIADSLGRQLPPGGDASSAIAEMLARQSRLIVLDNFESLLARDEAHSGEAIGAVLKILASGPGVRIVVTSREVLGVQEEWIYEVHGLAHRDEASVATAAHLPAVELFAQRARQAYLGFSLNAEMPHVLRICALVEGLPLGIELAAAWVRTIPCADISAAIETAAAALVSPHRNRPHRHKSLEAVVACSWNLLREDQRDALAGLGIFSGGFSRDTAERIADAPLRTLSALADKALVRRRSEGRYDLHEIVRQFALARLRASRARSALVTRRHTSHFSELLQRLIAELRTPAEVTADQLLRSEFPNILAAWHRAMSAPDVETVERMAAPLIAILHTRGRLPEAMTEAERSVALLDKRSRKGAPMQLRMQWGRVAIGRSPEIASRELEAACAQARAAGDSDVLARHLYYLGNLAYSQGDIARAEAIADEALALGRDSTNAELRMLVYNLRGTLANMRSRFDVAEALLAKGLEAARELGAPSAIGGMLCSLGVPMYYTGRFAESAALNSEAAALYERLGRNATATNVRSNLASIEFALGNVAQALEHGRIAVRLAREAGDDHALAHALVNFGEALHASGETGAAREAIDEAARIARHEPLTYTDAMQLLAMFDLGERRFDAALANIARLRDVLAEHRLEVRIPMLVLVTAAYALATRTGVAEALRWLWSLVEIEGVDASLKRKARALLETSHAEGDVASKPVVRASSQLEQEAMAFLSKVAPAPA